MSDLLYFDSASTTRCCKAAIDSLVQFAGTDFGNPSSVHCMGQKSAQAIRQARAFFAKNFGVEPNQVVFTGSGTEANNLALFGAALQNGNPPLRELPASSSKAPHVLTTTVEHAAIRNTVQALSDLGLTPGWIQLKDPCTPVIDPSTLTANLRVASIQSVNNISGSIFDVQTLAAQIKAKAPQTIVHTDAIQAFAKIPTVKSGSSVDLISISAHKIGGPKGVGALIILNKKLLKTIRPIIWGGGQENGFRSGTENPGLIFGFFQAAELALAHQTQNFNHAKKLRDHFKSELLKLKLMSEDETSGQLSAPITWNSPDQGSPYIINLSVPGYPPGVFAMMLEERNCLISVGSACNSNKASADPVLQAMGYPQEVYSAGFRVSLSSSLELKDMETLAQAILESHAQMCRLRPKR